MAVAGYIFRGLTLFHQVFRGLEYTNNKSQAYTNTISDFFGGYSPPKTTTRRYTTSLASFETVYALPDHQYEYCFTNDYF